MCGIAGMINKRPGAANIRECLRYCRVTMGHRGPDDYGDYFSPQGGFLNLRLSVVDKVGGRQPIFNDDRLRGIVYNGEVYNFSDLRLKLIAKGYHFATQSDTEAILKLYEEFGTASFRMLNGMFAFCLWDQQEGAIYLVRDQVGVKPLYVYEDEEKIAFSSELKGLLAIPGVDLSVDPAGVQDYLTFRFVQAPYSVFKRIRRVEAGTYLRIKDGVITHFRYWDTHYSNPFPAPDLKSAKEELLERMGGAVRSQLMGEVPIGMLLSGGIDSSAIAYFIHRAGADLTTFNIGFPEANEFDFSRTVAKRLGLRHVEIMTTTEEIVSHFERIMLAFDEPTGDPACLPLYMLCEELKKHVTVVLSGEGGDELFGGYPQYAQMLLEKHPYGDRFMAFLANSWYSSNVLDLLADKALPQHHLRHRKYFEGQTLLQGMLAYDMKTWMPENLMMKADKILMAHSLEGRFPFLDAGMVTFASTLPQHFKISPAGITKFILKDAMNPYLPAMVIQRQKMGFTVPVAQLLGKLRKLVLETVSAAKTSPVADVLEMRLLEKYVERYYCEGSVQPLVIWTLFILCYWFVTCYRQYRTGRALLPGRGGIAGDRPIW